MAALEQRHERGRAQFLQDRYDAVVRLPSELDGVREIIDIDQQFDWNAATTVYDDENRKQNKKTHQYFVRIV